MGLIIVSSDFTGDNAISKNAYTKAELDLAIAEFEETFIYQLLGIELAGSFIANLTNHAPTNPDYLEFFNPFYKEINNVMVISKGMKLMLVMLIYFEYVRKQSQVNTIDGNKQNQSSISKESAMNYTSLVLKQNDAVGTYKAIQKFIESEKTTKYPTYKGICKEYASWA